MKFGDYRIGLSEVYELQQLSNKDLVKRFASIFPNMKLQQVKAVKYIKNIGLKEAKEIVDKFYEYLEDTDSKLWIIASHGNHGLIVHVFRGTELECDSFKSRTSTVWDDNITLEVHDFESGLLFDSTNL